MIPFQVDNIDEVEEGPAVARLRTWRLPQCPFWIECPAAVLDQIRQEAEDARNGARGPQETGGVLYGRNGLGRVHIAAYRPLRCEHAMGPGFVLSAGDEKRLASLLAPRGADPELSGLQPVGWYHSHIASKIFLSERDRQVHGRFFASPFHIALVLRPSAERATRAGFFFKESGGAMRTDSAYEEFVLEHAPAAPEARPTAATLAEVPIRRPKQEKAAPAPDQAACPKCGSSQIRRSHRVSSMERIWGILGYYPYRCQECLSRSFLKRSSVLLELIHPNTGKRPEERRRAWLRTRREFLLWGAGIVGFLLILMYMVRDAGPKQDQP